MSSHTIIDDNGCGYYKIHFSKLELIQMLVRLEVITQDYYFNWTLKYL